MKTLLSLLIFIGLNQSFGQSYQTRKEIDSLKYEISIAKNDSLKIQALVAWQNLIYISDPELDYKLNLEVIGICKKNLVRTSEKTNQNFFLTELAYAYNNAATYEEFIGNYLLAIEHLNLSVKVGKAIENHNVVANAYNNLGNNYRYLDQNEKAINYYDQSLTYRKSTQNKHDEATTYNNIGLVYMDMEDFIQARTYFDQAMIMFSEIGEPDGLALILFNMGEIHLRSGELDSAFNTYETSLKLATEVGDKARMSSCLNKLGEINLLYATSELNPVKQLQFQKKALEYFNQAVILARDSQGILELIEVLENTYKTQKKLNYFEQAYQSLEEFQKVKNSADSLLNRRALIESEYRYAYEAKYELDSLKRVEENRLNQSQLENQKHQKIFLLIGLIMVVIFAGSLYNRFRHSRIQNTIIAEQKKLVEEKQSEILDSIEYAKRIQNAILPSEHFLKSLNLRYHLSYLPKDIVAGDFFWFVKNENLILFAVADCTGHGVPGAMVSVVCHNCLNRSVNEFKLTDPGEILDQTRKLVVEEFSKNEHEVKDGMDISLCVYDPNSKTLKWSGANNPLWIYNKSEWNEIKPDKQPIGQTSNPIPFKTHSFKAETGQRIFIFSDGLQDQFGGFNGSGKSKKFKSSQMKQILADHADKNLDEQCSELIAKFHEWKNREPQTDDVCFLGIEIA